ncbi:hypothetical protein V493_00949 [Pseudogymnoascus sp. VKM F-4281 (FW-2241)]|nr:hypothetical protein V493_00949 [Pseudogymnoascus sp. VKM F-4281 (FW-2241)]
MMNTVKCMRPRVSQFRPSSLPRVTRSFSASANQQYEFILTSEPRAGVAQITLNRPKALNALSTPLITELNQALREFQASPSVRAIVLTGSERAFAAGADIKEMAPLTFSKAYTEKFIESWSDLTTFLTKPLITAVSGHALGGGCELALMGDILYCTETANFGQPEIKLGTIPGAGGSQRLTAAVGKARAMELILTGKSFTGVEAEKWGVAARSFQDYEALIKAALDTAETIAGYSKVAVQAGKEVVNKSQDLTLRDGIDYERRVFHSLFGSEDQKIGMKAFAEKAKAQWVDHTANFVNFSPSNEATLLSSSQANNLLLGSEDEPLYIPMKIHIKANEAPATDKIPAMRIEPSANGLWRSMMLEGRGGKNRRTGDRNRSTGDSVRGMVTRCVDGNRGCPKQAGLGNMSNLNKELTFLSAA